jgi:hypothetical protein
VAEVKAGEQVTRKERFRGPSSTPLGGPFEPDAWQEHFYRVQLPQSGSANVLVLGLRADTIPFQTVIAGQCHGLNMQTTKYSLMTVNYLPSARVKIKTAFACANAV